MGETKDEESDATRVQLYHKEEVKARIQADAKDRAGLRRKLDYCIDPMDSKEHPEGSIVNTVSGKLAPTSVNVENAVMIGETMLEDSRRHGRKDSTAPSPRKWRQWRHHAHL